MPVLRGMNPTALKSVKKYIFKFKQRRKVCTFPKFKASYLDLTGF